MRETIDRLSDIQKKALNAFQTVQTLQELQAAYDTFLGKKSDLSEISKSMKTLDPEAKKSIGQALASARSAIEDRYETLRKKLEIAELEQKLLQEWIDVTKSSSFTGGALHPVSRVQRRIEEIFTSMGFEIADGPEVETEWHNFDALNIPGTHPARDMQDTFWIENSRSDSHENLVLRTHTSPVQIRRMLSRGAPVRAIVPGRVFRNEATDMTHDSTFYQVEGLVVDKGITLAHLKGALETILSKVFEREMKVRIRPGYFPFVEPGLEVDIWYEFTDRFGRERGMWMEFTGAGMIHPNVLRAGGIDPEVYSGFAFGFGLSRLVMMKYGIDDLRLLSSKKIDFLRQF